MNNTIKKVIAVFACICLIFSFSGCKKEKQFEAPKDYASLVQVTINPTVNLYLDSASVVLAVEYINTDATDAYKPLEQQIIGAKFDTALNSIVTTAADKGYLKEGGDVTVDILNSVSEDTTEILKTSATVIENVSVKKELTFNVVTKTRGEAAEPPTVPSSPETPESPSDTPPKNNEPPSSHSPSSHSPSSPTPSWHAPSTPTPTPTATLKKNTKYVDIYTDDYGNVLVVSMTFRDSECAYSELLYSSNAYEGANTYTYNGKTYYEDGGRGGGFDYTVNGNTVTLTDHKFHEVTLTLNTNGTITVSATRSLTYEPYSDAFKQGHIFKENQ